MKHRMKHAFGTLLLSAAIVTSWALPASAVEFLNGTAVAVTGDSITVGAIGHPNRTVGLWGIEAPDMGDDRDYGLYARAALDDLLRQHGGRVKCVLDSFDRSSAVCHAGAVDLGAAMLKTGWAVADRLVILTDVPGGDSERDRRGAAYDEAEAEARQGRKGRWAKMP
jgi:endonuclease YncB( thermonuclease family)